MGLTLSKAEKCSDNGQRIISDKGPKARNASGCKHWQYSAHKTPPIFCTLHTGQREDRVEASHCELRPGGQNLQSRRRHFYDYFTGSKRANFAWHDRKNIWCILWSGGTMPPARHCPCSIHIQISITKDPAEEMSIKGDSTPLYSALAVIVRHKNYL